MVKSWDSVDVCYCVINCHSLELLNCALVTKALVLQGLDKNTIVQTTQSENTVTCCLQRFVKMWLCSGDVYNGPSVAYISAANTKCEA